MNKIPRFTVRLAIAEAFGLDYADIENDYRYQDTRTPCAVYSICEGYFTATVSATKKPKGNKEYSWETVNPATGYIPSSWQIWQAIRD